VGGARRPSRRPDNSASRTWCGRPKQFYDILPGDKWKIKPEGAYMYYCSNETINGLTLYDLNLERHIATDNDLGCISLSRIHSSSKLRTATMSQTPTTKPMTTTHRSLKTKIPE
jgi:hypothetical protein